MRPLVSQVAKKPWHSSITILESTAWDFSAYVLDDVSGFTTRVSVSIWFTKTLGNSIAFGYWPYIYSLLNNSHSRSGYPFRLLSTLATSRCLSRLQLCTVNNLVSWAFQYPLLRNPVAPQASNLSPSGTDHIISLLDLGFEHFDDLIPRERLWLSVDH